MSALDAELLRAARAGAGSRLASLLAKGANANAYDADGETALHRATRSGSVEAVQLLAAAGADPRALNRVKNPPMMAAASK